MTRRHACRTAAACLTIACLTTACGADRGGDARQPAAGETATREAAAGGGAPRHPVRAIQLASLADSARAAAMRDSLASEGWPASAATRATVDGAVRWRVTVLRTADDALLALASGALRAEGRDALPAAARDSGVEDAAAAIVNAGVQGMAARVRWASSPDRRTLIAIEDPRGVENDALPNGVVIADERTGQLFRRDGVWDAAPSPGWRLVAWSRALTAQAEGDDSIAPGRWRSLAAALPPEATRALAGGSRDRLATMLRARSWPVSGMSSARGVGVVYVAPLADSSIGDDATRTPIRVGGWRLGWTAAGDTLAIGGAPRMAADDAPSASYALVTATGDRGPVRGDRLATLAWTAGPELEAGSHPDLREARAITVAGGRVVGEGGWIRLVRSGEGKGRIVGPGVPLAATATGRFVVALAPNPEAERHDPAALLVVYRVP